jgi:hypothetical protein
LEGHDGADGTGRNRYDGRPLVMTALDDPGRPELVRRVRRELEAGRYHPPAEAVAEQLLAWLAPPSRW